MFESSKHTEKTKRKMRLSKIGDKNPAKRKGVRLKIKTTILRKYREGIKMGFQKGNKLGTLKKGKPSPLKGRRRPPEVGKKVSEALKGHSVSENTRRKIGIGNKGKSHVPWNKDKKMPEGFGRKIGEYNKRIGRVPPSSLGKKRSIKTRRKMSNSRKGDKCYLWKDGITPINKKIRNGIESRLWREANFARDNWTCQKCKERGGVLHSHHIYNFSQYPELRFAIDNGITFCKNCHDKFHKIYGKKNNTREQVEEFLLSR